MRQTQDIVTSKEKMAKVNKKLKIYKSKDTNNFSGIRSQNTCSALVRGLYLQYYLYYGTILT